MQHRDRSDRNRLQETISQLGTVHPYRQRIDDPEHILIGWWVSPAPATTGCFCGLCYAALDGRDVHLGSITRTALIEAGRLVNDHFVQQRLAPLPNP
ncbi:MAG TPA: hypothetical protein VK613_04920 [Gaiellaceae bacterium]|nr:hypothetical protein [Gaiellaceae bacterium]